MKYLKIFTDFLEIAEGLSDNTLARLFRAMLAYALNDTEPAFKGNERALWLMVRQSIDREKEAYEAKIEADRKNGRKGAAIRWQKIAKDRDPYPTDGQDSQDKDKEKEKDEDKDEDKGIYIAPAPRAHIYIRPPSLEEVESYCQERGSQVDPHYFHSYYESNGWKVGKNPMKDWKAAVRSWESNGMGERVSHQEPTVGDNFRKAMEMLRRKEAKQV